jgi:hypothetical protein
MRIGRLVIADAERLELLRDELRKAKSLAYSASWGETWMTEEEVISYLEDVVSVALRELDRMLGYKKGDRRTTRNRNK